MGLSFSPPEKGFYVVGFLSLILACLHISELGVFVFFLGSGQWGRDLGVLCSFIWRAFARVALYPVSRTWNTLFYILLFDFYLRL